MTYRTAVARKGQVVIYNNTHPKCKVRKPCTLVDVAGTKGIVDLGGDTLATVPLSLLLPVKGVRDAELAA